MDYFKRELWGGVALATILNVPALAQQVSAPVTAAAPTAAQASDAGLAEIVVTAQKRAQSILDVPITVAAVSSQELQAAGVTDVALLTNVVPGFNATVNYAGYMIFGIRGVNFNAGSLEAQSTVNTYIDEAIIPYPSETAGLLLDVDRVEVLKGPQGTLFGQNVTGGAINIIAAKPTRDFAAGAELTINNFGNLMANGFVSGPLNDTLLARLAVSTSHFGAWQEGYYLDHSKNGADDKAAARLLLDWTPVDKLKISLNLNGNYDHGQGQNLQFAYANPTGPLKPLEIGLLGYPQPHNDRAADADPGLDTHRRNSFYQSVLRIDDTISDDLSLTSITDYTNYAQHAPYDGDGTAYPINQVTAHGTISSISQELRLTGQIPSASVRYIVGGNFQNDSVIDGFFQGPFNYSAVPTGLRDDPFSHINNTSSGIFANGDWDFADHVSLTGGLRYSAVIERNRGCVADAGDGSAAGFFGGLANYLRFSAGVPPTNAYMPGKCVVINDRPVLAGGLASFLPYDSNDIQKEHNLSWRGGLNYKPVQDSLLYVSVSRGYKAGGFPTGDNFLASQTAPYKQEELTSYEVGAKTALFDRKLVLEGSVFYYDYANKQFLTFYETVIGPLQTYRNVPKSTLKGVDFDLTAKPIRPLTLRAAVTFVESALGNYESFNLATGAAENVAGNPFNYAPRWSGTLDAEYRMPINDHLDGLIGANAATNSKTYGDLARTPELTIDAYTIADLRIGVESKRWHASAWVRNIADKWYWTYAGPSPDTITRLTGLPRTFGVTVGYKF